MKITKKILTATAALMFASSFIFAQESEQPAPVSEAYVEEASDTEAKTSTAVNTESDTYEEPKAVTSSEADTYEEPAAAASAGTDTYEEAAAPASSNSTSTAKKSNSNVKNPFEGFFTPEGAEYKMYANIPLSTGTIGFNIKHRNADVFVDPKTKKAGIQFYFQSAWFNLKFDSKDIALINECYEKYLEDFSNHKLIKNNALKTRKMYTGKGNTRIEWGTIKIMMDNYGDAKFQVGYEFKNKSPYFCIIVKDAKNLVTTSGTNVAARSTEVQLYFTKAEAKQFLEALSRERVKEELDAISAATQVQLDNY